MIARPASFLFVALAACSGAAAPERGGSPAKMQVAFYHFQDDHVRVTVDGKPVFDKAVTVAPDNARLGLAAVAQIDLPACSDIAVTSKKGKASERICLTAQTKSIVIDGGPPLTIAAKDQFQGAD